MITSEGMDFDVFDAFGSGIYSSGSGIYSSGVSGSSSYSAGVFGSESDSSGDSSSYGLDLYDLDSYDLSGIEEYLRGQQDNSGLHLSFHELMENLLAGRLGDVLGQVGTALKDALFAEVKASGGMMGQILVLGIIGAVFANFSSVFSGSQISETGFYVTYLLLLTYLAASFFTSISIAGKVVDQVLGFMKVLMPAYFLAAAFAGGSMSAASSYGFTLFAIGAAQAVAAGVLLPVVRVYALLVMAGHITKEDMLSKLTELLASAVRWSLKTMMGIVLGFHILQGMVLPYVDAVKTGTVQKVLEVIPGVGAGAGAVTRLVMGSGVLIKNTIGAAGVVVLAVLVLVPMLKLVVLMVLYQVVAAVLQPVCDKRIVSCISEMAEGHKLLLGIASAAILLFVITIAVVCASSNVTYYAGG